MNIFEALSVFDWITPAVNVKRVAFGMRPISIHWSPKKPAYYERLLKQRGIEAKPGGIVAGKGFIIMVPKGDVERACNILAKAKANIACR